MEKLSQAFIPLLDESQVDQVTRELQNLGQRAAMKLRQGRVLFIGLDWIGFLHDLLVEYFNFHSMLLLPAAIAAGSSNGVTNTRCCRYSCIRS